MPFNSSDTITYCSNLMACVGRGEAQRLRLVPAVQSTKPRRPAPSVMTGGCLLSGPGGSVLAEPLDGERRGQPPDRKSVV